MECVILCNESHETQDITTTDEQIQTVDNPMNEFKQASGWSYRPKILNFFFLETVDRNKTRQKEDNQTIKNTVPENEHYLWIKEADENTETWDLKRNLGIKIKKQNITKPFMDRLSRK